MNAQFVAIAIFLLRRQCRKNALSSDYLFMDVQAYSGDSPIGDLKIAKLSNSLGDQTFSISRCPDFAMS